MANVKKKVIMSGEGNFTIGDETYSFKDGEEVTAKKAEHVELLEAEAKRREALKPVRVSGAKG